VRMNEHPRKHEEKDADAEKLPLSLFHFLHLSILLHSILVFS